ncbi:MAG: hypothetical protein ACMUIA_05335, partial [bacterium]
MDTKDAQARRERGENKQYGSRITISWPELKRFLKLDSDQIALTWEEFERLSRQADPDFKPHNDSSPYDSLDGKILLSHQEFMNLLNSFKPLPQDDAGPLRDYLFTRSLYTGRMDNDDFTFTADFSLTVLKEMAYVTVPILSASLALENMTVNGRPAVVVHEGGHHCILLDKPGEYEVRAVFFIKSSLDKGPQRLQFPIRGIPITLVDLELSRPDLEVEMPSAQYLETGFEKDKTRIKAVLVTCTSFDLQWKRKTAGVEEKVPAMIYAEAYQLISVEDDALKINQDFLYHVLQSGVGSLRMAVPEGITVLSVSGPGVGEWRETEEEGGRILHIPLNYEQKGKFHLTVLAEKSFPDKAAMVEFSGLEALDTVNGLGEKGYIGVEMKTGAELVLKESSGLEKVMVKNLPQPLFHKSTNPLLLGFKYLKHPFHLVLDIRKHEKVALPQAAIDSANAVSFLTEEGLVISKIEYSVKNQLKQSLRLKMPEGAFIWSAMVGKDMAEVRRDKDCIYIPLISSRQHDQKLESFTVEVIYYTESQNFDLWGRRLITLPQPDLTVSQILWSLYLPERFVYYRFMTNLEKEALASGLTPILNRKEMKVTLPEKNSYGWRETTLPSGEDTRLPGYAGKREATTFRNIDVSGSLMSQQAMTEFNFDKRLQQIEDTMIQGEARMYAGAEVLPMNIEIPASGQLYRFAKNIVRDEQLEIRVHYFTETLYQVMSWLIILIILMVLVLWRSRLQAFALALSGKTKKLILAGCAVARRFFSSLWSLPIMGFLFLLSLAAGDGMDIVASFLLMWTAAMIHLDRRIKRYKGRAGARDLVIFLLVCTGLGMWIKAPVAWGQQDKLQQQESQVSLDWSEFKRSVGLDKDEIQLTWDEFQAIINQTARRVKPVYTIRKGLVTLSREQFDSLLSRMIAPRREIPVPLDYRLTRAVYKGKMGQNWTTITADFTLEVLDKTGPQLIPFLPAQVGLQEVAINGRPVLLLSEGGYHQLVLENPGSYRIKAVFYMRSSLNETQYQVSIPVQETSVTLLELEIPLREIRVEVPQAQQVTVSPRAESTMVSAVFPPVRNLTIQWYGRKKVTPVKRVPVSARLYAGSYHLISLDDDALKAATEVECNILQAGLHELEFLIPDGWHILSVEGQGVGEWRERKEDARRILLINLDYEHKGLFRLTIGSEKTLLDEGTSRFSFSTLKVLKAVRDTGYIGMELRSSAEVTILSHEGLEKIAVPKLPQPLFRRALKPLIYGFRYSQHPHTIELDIERHPKVSVTMAVVDAVNAVSFFAGDGKVVHRIVYEVRNQLKQFLKVQLPEGSELWSVLVGDKPAEPAREKDVLYIPLIRSQEHGQRLKPFNVELVYYQKDYPFSAYGRTSVFLPEVIEVIVSKVLWSLYLPKDYDFLHFRGNMEKERLISGLRPIMGCSLAGSKRAHRLGSVMMEKRASLSEPLECLDEEAPSIAQSDTEFKKFKAGRKDMMKQQVIETGLAPAPKPEKRAEPEGLQTPRPAELQSRITGEGGGIVSSYDTAVMSVPVSIPVSGQLYRFAKTAVRQEPLCITITYTRDWIMSSIVWFIIFVVVAVLFIFRKRLYV